MYFYHQYQLKDERVNSGISTLLYELKNSSLQSNHRSNANFEIDTWRARVKNRRERVQQSVSPKLRHDQHL